MMLTVAVSLMYSPKPSSPEIRRGLSGVKVSITLSSFSREMKSCLVYSKISALFVTAMAGSISSKSETPIHWPDHTYINVKKCYLLAVPPATAIIIPETERAPPNLDSPFTLR